LVRKKVLTDDGSLTRFHPEYEEHYHSLSGARQEALLRFVKPCRLIETAKARGKLRFLDVGFGLGINVAVTLEQVFKYVPEAHCEWVSLEKEILDLKDLQPHFGEEMVSTILETFVNHGQVETSHCCGRLLEGDACEVVAEVEGSFDAIFLDPFSPRKNPEMWSEGFMRALWEVCAEGGILSTYSAAASVRLALMEAGWEIGLGPRVGKKSSGTVASKGPADPPLPQLDEKQRRSLVRRLRN